MTVRVIKNLPAAEYHRRRLGEVSSSALREVGRSPAHYLAWLNAPDQEPSRAMMLGSLVHAMVLEPDVAASSYAVEPDFGDCRTKANKERRDAWRAENAGRTMVEQTMADQAAGMVEALRRHPLSAALLDGPGDAELSLFWEDSTGLPCKARLDRYVHGRAVVLDLKTTGDARSKAFAKSIADFGYHVQAAHYTAGCKAVGLDVIHWLFVVVEREPPHAVAIYTLDTETMARGEDRRRHCITTLADCMSRDVWPAYPTSIEPIGLPAWAQE